MNKNMGVPILASDSSGKLLSEKKLRSLHKYIQDNYDKVIPRKDVPVAACPELNPSRRRS